MRNPGSLNIIYGYRQPVFSQNNQAFTFIYICGGVLTLAGPMMKAYD